MRPYFSPFFRKYEYDTIFSPFFGNLNGNKSAHILKETDECQIIEQWQQISLDTDCNKSSWLQVGIINSAQFKADIEGYLKMSCL